MKQICSIGIALSITKGKEYRLLPHILQILDTVQHRHKQITVHFRRCIKAITYTLSPVIPWKGFAISPDHGRDRFWTASALLRVCSDSLPKRQPTILEADSKPTRSRFEEGVNKDRTNTLERLKKGQTNGKGTAKKPQTNNKGLGQFAFLPTSPFVSPLFGAPPPQLNLSITKSLRRHHDKGEDKVVIRWSEGSKAPKRGRRISEECPKKTRKIGVSLAQAYDDYRMSLAQACNDYRMSLAQAYDDYRMNLPIDYLCTALSLQQASDKDRLSLPIVHQGCTQGVPLVHGKGTEKVLQRYWRFTKKVLKSYQRGTAHLRAAGKWIVDKMGIKGHTALSWVPEEREASVTEMKVKDYVVPSRNEGKNNPVKGGGIMSLKSTHLQVIYSTILQRARLKLSGVLSSLKRALNGLIQRGCNLQQIAQGRLENSDCEHRYHNSTFKGFHHNFLTRYRPRSLKREVDCNSLRNRDAKSIENYEKRLIGNGHWHIAYRLRRTGNGIKAILRRLLPALKRKMPRVYGLLLSAYCKILIIYCKVLIAQSRCRIAYCKLLIACCKKLILSVNRQETNDLTSDKKSFTLRMMMAGLLLGIRIRKLMTYRKKLIAYSRWLMVLVQLFTIVSMFNVSAQELPGNQRAANGSMAISPMQIGDTIPEALWHMPLQVVNHPAGKEVVTLNDYRHKKLIVLDFWATWCVPCIASLKKLSSLQSQFEEELIVLPITNETEAKWQRFQTIQQLSLPSVIEERKVQQYFPHKVVPHQIWIKDGKLLTKSSAEYATAANISRVMAGQQVKTMTYEAGGRQTLDALLERQSHDGNIRPEMYSALYPRLKDESSAIRKEGNRFAAINFPIVSLFQLAFSNHIPFGEMELRTAIEIDDSTLKAKVDFVLLRTGDFGRDSLLSAQADSLQYTYVVEKTDGLSKKSALDMMEQDVTAFFRDRYGLEAYISHRPVKCMLLERAPDMDKLPAIHTVDSNHYRYEGVPALVRALRYQCKTKGYYVVDGVQGQRNLTVTLSQQLDDIASFNRALSSYDLHLRETTREMPVLVLTDGRRQYEN